MKAYYNENDPKAAAWLRELINSGLIMAGDVDERSIEDVQPDDVAGYVRCHFFAGIGGWDYALQLAGWPDDRPVWTGSCPCGPFSIGGEKKARETRVTCGRISTGSQSTKNLTRLLASRLQTRFPTGGSTDYAMTWKIRATPSGRRYYQLVVSAQSMLGKDSTGWPTPAARDGRDISRSKAFLSQRKRHSPSMATHLLEQGAPWQVITAIYCLAMGFPSSWNVTRLGVTAMQSFRKSPQSSSRHISKQKKAVHFP